MKKLKDLKFGWYYNARIRKQYVSLILIPTIEFIYDSQSNQTIKFGDEIFNSEIELSLDINWLWLHIGVDLIIKTNKKLSELE